MSPARTSGRATLFGKLPAALDYVRINHDSAAAVAFDGWLQSALQFLASRDASWPNQRLRFVYRGVAGAQPLVGIVAPSRDRAGRRFPVALFAAAPALPRVNDSVLALASERFLADAARTLDQLAGASVADATAALEELACLDAEEVEAAVAPAEALLAEPAAALLELVPATDSATRYARVAAVVHALQELPPHRHLVLDLPASRAEERARWLALHARTAMRDAGAVSWFWLDEAPGPRLMLVTGAAPPALPFWAGSPTARNERLLSLRSVGTELSSSDELEELPGSATLRDLTIVLSAEGA